MSKLPGFEGFKADRLEKRPVGDGICEVCDEWSSQLFSVVGHYGDFSEEFYNAEGVPLENCNDCIKIINDIIKEENPDSIVVT